MVSIEDRFWSKVDTSGSCWEWTGSKDGDGYGMLWVTSRMHRAHRVSYELARGPIEGGLLVDHKCHNRACVNPEHLRLATRKQNAENRIGAQPSSGTGIRGVGWDRGSRRWRATVTHNRETFNVGSFTSIVEAESAVIAKRLELYTHNEVDRVRALNKGNES